MWIKLLLIGASLALLFYFFVHARTRPMQKLGMSATFLLIIGFTLYPDSATWVAHLVGVGRGVDLVFYLCSLVLLGISFNLYLGLKSQEDKLTVVVRTLALMNAERNGAPVRSSDPPGSVN
jgi:hypothetical protein